MQTRENLSIPTINKEKITKQKKTTHTTKEIQMMSYCRNRQAIHAPTYNKANFDARSSRNIFNRKGQNNQ
jgi:hypothetical protein